jgi:hypothetical protein
MIWDVVSNKDFVLIRQLVDSSIGVWLICLAQCTVHDRDQIFFCHFSNVQVNTNIGTSLHEYEDHPPFGPLSHALHHSVVSCSSRTTWSATPSWAKPYVNSNTYMSRDSPNFLISGKNIKKMKLWCLCTLVNETPYTLYWSWCSIM